MLDRAEIINHKFQGRSFNIRVNKELIKITKISSIFFVDKVIIAKKDKGIANSRLKYSGIKCPNHIPRNVEICHVNQRVIPLPSK